MSWLRRFWFPIAVCAVVGLLILWPVLTGHTITI